MIIVDANILVYAHMPKLTQHKVAARWLELTLSESIDTIGLCWQAVNAFLRVSTNPRIFEEPIDISTARSYLNDLFLHPLVHQVHTTDRHWAIFSTILSDLNLRGDIVMDAHIAALAIEHKAVVASSDKDFRRFSDHVKLIDPLR